ncbi:MAG: polymerase subunit delta [Burkholderiaceae bacterium]|nr:polymerase subunit delta [Burkholderiaceae bacterium]
MFPWQLGWWQQWQQMRASLPHALLFYGPAGIGKTAFAEHLAQSLLCENALPDGQACGKCVSCGWFAQYSHPDYRRIRPGALDVAEAKEADDADENDAGDGGSDAGTKGVKAGSKVIRIAQVRELADFMNISTHRQGRRVVLLYPADALNAESSNALLKTLEEPLPGTVMLLVADNLDGVLPTILSRCRKFPLPMPPREQALAWLREQGVEDADAWLAEQGGAPLAALAMAQTGRHDELDEFLRQLIRPEVDGVLRAAEKLQKMPAAELIVWLQRWLYDIFSAKYSGRIRYYPRFAREIEMLALRVDADKLLRMLKATSARKAIADHPLAPRLFIEDMLLDYLEFCS